jgi:hypothetical protein
MKFYSVIEKLKTKAVINKKNYQSFSPYCLSWMLWVSDFGCSLFFNTFLSFPSKICPDCQGKTQTKTLKHPFGQLFLPNVTKIEHFCTFPKDLLGPSSAKSSCDQAIVSIS